MSTGFAAVPNWLVEEPTVSAHEKLVYLVLSSKIGDQGAWFISHSKIGELAGISTRSVQRALDALRERGVVTWEPRFDETNNAQLGNSYRLMTDRLGQGDRPPRSERPTPPVTVADQNKNPEKEPIDTPPTPSEVDVSFDALWLLWPKKEDRATARRAWGKLTKTVRDEVTPKLVAHAKAHRQNTPPQFIPRLSTMIRNERWDDPVAVDRTRGSYNPEPLAQAPIDDSPFDATGALRIPKGMKPEYDDDGRFVRFVPLRGE